MPEWLPSVPYPSPTDGYWSPVTSTLNWCEEDYYATHYIAELINSLTNLWFVYLGIQGIRNCIANKHPQIYLWGFVSYVVIGIGSFAFHATLKHEMQLLDELSMIYTTCILFFAVFSYGSESHAKTWALGLGTVGIAVGVTVAYQIIGNPVFHQNAFGILTAAQFFKGLHLQQTRLVPSAGSAKKSVSKKGSSGKAWSQEDEARLKSDMMWIVWYGLITVASGFLIWNLDTIFCGHWRSWRRSIGLPWGMLLEGHGWWHLLTGTAEYCNLVWNIALRYGLDGKQDDIEIVWSSLLTSMPVVQRRNRSSRAKRE